MFKIPEEKQLNRFRFLPKNKCIRIFLLLFTIWLIVSAYFYFQHYRTEKVYTLDKEVKVGGNTVKFKELSLVNYTMKAKDDIFEFPWYFMYANNLPEPIRFPFIRVCMFYTPSPYEYSDKIGTLSVKGYITSEEGNLATDKVTDSIDIWLADPYEVGYSGGFGIENDSSDGSFVIFERKGKNVPLDSKDISIMVTDKKHESNQKITLQPEWETKRYTFFKKKQHHSSFSPVKTAATFIRLLKEDKKREAEQLILPEERSSFQWPNVKHSYWEMPYQEDINYVGSYLGYENVCSVIISFREFKEVNLYSDVEQTLYLIDVNGGWKIIDIRPVRNY